MEFFIWTGIMICLIHSAVFSGLNLGFFGLSRLRLEVEGELNNEDAKRILSLREDSHFLLTTILWGNVMSNVLLALLSESLLTGVSAFVFSTVFITIIAEILPQAYFAKNALKMSTFLVPIVKFYQFILYPIAKPTALFLDRFLGKEKIEYFTEKALKVILAKHARANTTNISLLESKGAVNFLDLDEVNLEEEGSVLDPKSVISLSVDKDNLPMFPDYKPNLNDPFLKKIHASGKKWIIITDLLNQPLLALNINHFLGDTLFQEGKSNIFNYCHRPIIIKQLGVTLGHVIKQFKVNPKHLYDDVIDQDLILLWTDQQKRIITGADLLGRLLRGIVMPRGE